MITVLDRKGYCHGEVDSMQEARVLMRSITQNLGIPSWDLFMHREKDEVDTSEVFWSRFERQVSSYRREHGIF